MDLLDSGGDEAFPLRDYDKIKFAHYRYICTMDRPKIDQILPPTHPDLPRLPIGRWVPVMIEAPVSSVEVIEAILKPVQPFQIYTARHIPRQRVTHSRVPGTLAENQRLYDEYARWQGRLEKDDREISYICLSTRCLEKFRNHAVCWPVQLQYITIPWKDPGRSMGLSHPWALVLRFRHGIPRGYNSALASSTNAQRVQYLLEKIGIPGCQFELSLLWPDTVPLPESVLDWIEGIPGSTLALPYRCMDFRVQVQSTVEQEEDDSDATMDHPNN